MASRSITTLGGTDLVAALGGTLNDGDSVFLNFGNDTITGSLDQSAKTFPRVALIGEFEGSLGDAGTYFAAQITLLDLMCAARALYVKGGSGTGIIAKANLAPTRSDCQIVFGAGTFTEVNLEGGNLVAIDTANVNLLRQRGGSSTLRAGSANTPTIEINAGSCRCERDFDSADVRGGIFSVISVPGSTVPTPATISVASGAVLDYRGGDIGTSLTVYGGGTADLTKLPTARTIALVNNYPGAVLKAGPGMVTVTTYKFDNGPRFPL